MKIHEENKGMFVIMYIFDMRYENYKRYLSSCNIKGEIPKIGDILHIFLTSKLELPFFDFNVNTICSLRCKNCDQGIPYMNRKEQYSYIQLKEKFDCLLEKVDYVHQISIIGGEPLLNLDLDKILQYCCESNKIGSIILVTNGTIFPTNNILKILSHQKIQVGISWYPLKETKKRTELIRYFEKNSINYIVRRMNWLYFGDWRVNRHYSKKRLTENYRNCFLRNCVQYNNGVLYRCAKVVLLEDHNIEKPQMDERIDVINCSKKQFYKAIKCFYSSKYINACNHCNSGKELVEVPLGEQL